MAFAATATMLGFSSAFSASSVSLSAQNSVQLSSTSHPSLSGYPMVVCGRGDKRTAKGKRFRQSFGNARPRKANKSKGLPLVPLPPRPPKKDPLDDGEFIEIILDDSIFGKKAAQ